MLSFSILILFDRAPTGTIGFGAEWQNEFHASVLRDLSDGRELEANQDWLVLPTYARDPARAALDLLIDGECGWWQLANRATTTPGSRAHCRGTPQPRASMGA